MKNSNRFLSLFLASSILACSYTTAQATVAPKEDDYFSESHYELGYYTENGNEQECIVKFENISSLTNDPNEFGATRRVTYLIPTTTTENSYVEAFAASVESGISLLAMDEDVDIWWQCQYTIEVREEFEIRYVQTEPGKWENYKFVGIEWVKFGFYTYKDGEGKVSLRNPTVRAWLAGFTPNCFGSNVSQEKIITPPNNNYHVANGNSLIIWTPPSNWQKVASIPNLHAAGASFETTAVDGSGNTCEISIAAIIAAVPNP